MNDAYRIIPGLLIVAMSVLSFSGCANLKARVVPPLGAIYTKTSGPLILPGQEARGLNLEECSAQVYYVMIPVPFTAGTLSFTWDRADLEKALGPIRFEEIAYADYEFLSVMGVYAKMKITVYGV